MIAIPHKTKQFLLVSIKILIVTFAFFVIYRDFQGDKKFDSSAFSKTINLNTGFFLVFLSFMNWIFEILKWQHLVGSFKTISFFEATKQSLGSLTASIFTPNRIGEYGAKVLFYPKENRKKIVFLNFLSNYSQMMTTCFFGLVGFIFACIKFDISKLFHFDKTIVVFIIVFFVSLLILLFFIRKIEIYSFSIEKIIQKTRSLPNKIMLKTFAFSMLRYLLFSHQFYLLLLIFGSEIPYFESMSLIFLMYFVASIIPTIHLFDVVIKGSVALFLFHAFKADFYSNEWIVISTTTMMWLLNLVIPVLFGSYFVLQFKPQKT